MREEIGIGIGIVNGVVPRERRAAIPIEKRRGKKKSIEIGEGKGKIGNERRKRRGKELGSSENESLLECGLIDNDGKVFDLEVHPSTNLQTKLYILFIDKTIHEEIIKLTLIS